MKRTTSVRPSGQSVDRNHKRYIFRTVSFEFKDTYFLKDVTLLIYALCDVLLVLLDWTLSHVTIADNMLHVFVNAETKFSCRNVIKNSCNQTLLIYWIWAYPYN